MVNITDEMIAEVAAVAEHNRQREEREAIEAGRLIRVKWYTCNCDWITNHCDEYHSASALVPAHVLEGYRYR